MEENEVAFLLRLLNEICPNGVEAFTPPEETEKSKVQDYLISAIKDRLLGQGLMCSFQKGRWFCWCYSRVENKRTS